MDLGEDPANIIILTALDLEYGAVRRHLSNARTRRHPAGTLFEIGRLPDGVTDAAIAVTGAGNEGAAILAERAITMFRPAALLFVGIAGALHDDLALGDVVVATKVYGYHGGRDEDAGFLAHPSAWQAPHELEQLARHVARTGSWHRLLPATSPPRTPDIRFRPIAAGEVVLNSRTTSLAQQLRRTYNDAAAIEMESSGAARAGHLNRSLPVLAIRGISDRADGAKYATDGAGWQPSAAAHAAAFATALAVEFAAVATEAEPIAIGGTRTVNITAHAGGTAYGVAHGNMYINQPPAPGDDSTIPGPDWRPLTEPSNVAWRSELVPELNGYGRAALEIHLVPVGQIERLEVRRLQSLSDHLAVLGREHDLFTVTEPLRVESSDRSALVDSTDQRRGPAGLAVHRDGRRSAWTSLPHDVLGTVLDPHDLVARIERMLGLLSALGVPAPDRVALAVGIQPATGLSEGSVVDMPRRQASIGLRQPQYIRVPPEDTVPYGNLTDHRRDLAEELSARLMATFRRENR